jgi:hypothetical protein
MDTYSKKFQPVIAPPWNPSREAFDRYLAREVEMCIVNTARGRGGELHSEFVRSEARRISRTPVIANITVRTKLDGRWIGQA